MSPTHRLPRSVTPRHYDLTLVPDLEAASFEGTVRIDVDVESSVDEFVLNAAELEITAARLLGETPEPRELGVRLVPDDEVVVLSAPAVVDEGPWSIELEFRGILNDHLRGFYRSTFTDEEGEIRTIGVTQFEATDARRAFPSWDEPDLKATFDVTLVVAPDLLAISNTDPVDETVTTDGRKRIRFGRTIPMSTYLVAFVVGPLEATEPRDVDGTPLRIIHQPGKGAFTGYALDAAEFALRFLGDYYRIPYPGSKLDLIALPDFAWGAMENIGAVTFRENLLIIDPERASHSERLRITDVIAHEIAHMWFGDLVTMRWWDGVWLNEAFATFMELKTTDAARPDWHRWTSFGIEAGSAKEIDALAATRPIEFEVDSPDDANEMFDSLTYLKGSSVLRMLEQHIGEDQFCDGVAHYLRTHAFGNTETADLWRALEGTSGEPVGEIMDTWIRQGGFPAVTLGRDGDGYTLAQRRFTLLGETRDQRSWRVPVRVRSLATGEERRLLLGDTPHHVDIEGPLWANSHGYGFYLVEHEAAVFDEVVAHYNGLEALERFLLVDDAWALTIAGGMRLDRFLELVDRIDDEDEPAVWQVVVAAFTEIDRYIPDPLRVGFSGRSVALFGPALHRLTWDVGPDESDLDRKRRGLLIEALGRLASDADVVARSRRIVDEILTEGDEVDPDVAAAATGVAAWHGSVDDYARYVDRYENPATPQERVRFLFALPSFPEPEVAARTLEMVVDGRIRNQDGPYVIAGLLRNRRVNRQVWELMKQSWDEIGKVLPERTSRRVLEGLPALSEPGLAEDVMQWFAGHPTSHAKTEAQRLELLEVYRRFREREAPSLEALFRA